MATMATTTTTLLVYCNKNLTHCSSYTGRNANMVAQQCPFITDFGMTDIQVLITKTDKKNRKG